MRSLLFATMALALGAAFGSGLAVWRFKSAPWDRRLDETVQSGQAASARNEPESKVSVDRTEYDFGTVVNGTKYRHDFVFTNDGNAPLSLADGGTLNGNSIDVDVERSPLPPSDSAKVAVTWTPNGKAGSARSTVDVLTNDPGRPRITLTLSGNVIAQVRVVPSDLAFPHLSMDEPASASTLVLCHIQTPLKLLGHEWSEAAAAPYFDVALQPLSPDELKKESALSGFVVKVTVKPGLPPGPLRQTLLLKTNIASSPTVSVPISGAVESDIAVVGRGWDNEENALYLGHVAHDKGLKRTVVLVVRGRWRHDLRLKVAEVKPSFISVAIGKARDINDGVVVEIPLTIEVPPGSPSAAFLGARQGEPAEIVLQTADPRLPEFRIPLRLAIEG